MGMSDKLDLHQGVGVFSFQKSSFWIYAGFHVFVVLFNKEVKGVG